MLMQKRKINFQTFTVLLLLILSRSTNIKNRERWLWNLGGSGSFFNCNDRLENSLFSKLRRFLLVLTKNSVKLKSTTNKTEQNTYFNNKNWRNSFPSIFRGLIRRGRREFYQNGDLDCKHKGLMEKEKNKDKDKEKEKESEREIISIDLDDSDSNESPNDNVTSQEENDTSSGSGGPVTRSSEKVSRVIKTLTLKDHMKFMDNFDPELSNREKRKLSRKIYSDQGGRKSSTIYDENGVISGIDKDICDCLNPSCPGCHFPCSKCRSCKCGHECRINRRWMYELIENEGERTVTKNTFLNVT